MHLQMAEMRDNTRNLRKQRCFDLLHDAVVHTGSRIDSLNTDSLIGYIELAARTVSEPDMTELILRNKLAAMGFNTAPVN